MEMGIKSCSVNSTNHWGLEGPLLYFLSTLSAVEQKGSLCWKLKWMNEWSDWVSKKLKLLHRIVAYNKMQPVRLRWCSHSWNWVKLNRLFSGNAATLPGYVLVSVLLCRFIRNTVRSSADTDLSSLGEPLKGRLLFKLSQFHLWG